MYANSNSDLSFRMTVVRVIKLRLIWQPSLSLAPSAFVWEALSLPAKSTKFCMPLTPIVMINIQKRKSYKQRWSKEGMYLTMIPYQACNKRSYTIWIFSESTFYSLNCQQGISHQSYKNNWKKKLNKKNYLPKKLTSLIIWCDRELVSLRAVSPTCLWATIEFSCN